MAQSARLNDLVALAKNHKMTPAERRAQRAILVMGLRGHNSTLTREKVETLLGDLEGIAWASRNTWIVIKVLVYPDLYYGAGMFDTNWELIDGDVAHEIEVLNQSSQINLIEALVRFFLHHLTIEGEKLGKFPSQNALREIHRTATFLLLKQPGVYRDGPVHLAKEDGTILYVPPAADEVQGHMDQFFGAVGERWSALTPVAMGAYTLWLINWVHPFKNGNGRSARAFCYTYICLQMGFVLPGVPTVL
jgi:hypothetical protein